MKRVLVSIPDGAWKIIEKELLELLKISNAYPIYSALLMILCFSWIFIVGVPVVIVMTIMGYTPYQFDHAGILYIVCCIFAWISIPVIVKYSKGMHFAKRLLYIYIIAQLIMGVAIAIYPPFH
ncbi:MAG: hypothetical protein N2V77_06095 [Canidatus Methanoxibalbensis ujae]|nr:hypothetical protein [Candidatus Methanoxibalbensis ujae]